MKFKIFQNLSLIFYKNKMIYINRKLTCLPCIQTIQSSFKKQKFKIFYSVFVWYSRLSKSFCGFLKEIKRNNTKEALMQLALFALRNH